VLALALALSPHSRKRQLIAIGIAMVALDIALVVIDRSLQATGGPGIIGFEFVGSQANATRIMAEWGGHGRDLARLSLWLDFAFMASYGAFFAMAGFATRDWARARDLRALARAGALAPYFAIAAALFDMCENISLLLVLGGHGAAAAPVVATTCASVKFALITLAIAYVLWGLVARLSRRGAGRFRTG
jgi:hypothetical protein